MTAPPLFEKLTGVRFWVGDWVYNLQGAHYGNGCGAVQVFHESGEMELVLTTNLAPYGVAVPMQDELWVKTDRYSRSMHKKLLSMGLFIDSGTEVSQGYVEKYARLWRFAACETPCDGHTPGNYAVECAGCRANWEKEFANEEMRRNSRDVVRRLAGPQRGT